jgi:hypothetical protein
MSSPIKSWALALAWGAVENVVSTEACATGLAPVESVYQLRVIIQNGATNPNHAPGCREHRGRVGHSLP